MTSTESSQSTNIIMTGGVDSTHWVTLNRADPCCEVCGEPLLRGLSEGIQWRCSRCGGTLRGISSPPNIQEVPVAVHLYPRVSPDIYFPKMCFEKAYDFLCAHTRDDTMRLCHGLWRQELYRRFGLPACHAWVEIGADVAFDPNWQRFYNKDEYFRALSIEPLESYTYAEAIECHFATQHLGPWPHDLDISGEEAEEEPDEVESSCSHCGKAYSMLPLSVPRPWRCDACKIPFDVEIQPPALRQRRAPAALRRGTWPKLHFTPENWHSAAYCFTRAHDSQPGLTLVHGRRGGQAEEWPRKDSMHAWCEIGDDIAFDPEWQRFYDRDAYRALLNLSEEARYTSGEAYERATQHGTDGPWDDRALSDLTLDWADDELTMRQRTDIHHTIAAWYRDGTISRANLRSLLRTWWPSAEKPWTVGIDESVRIFEEAGFVGDHPDTARPTAELTIYREIMGAGELGMSWTTERDEATRFATWYVREGVEGMVYAAEVAPEHILALFTKRNESEVVVNPFGLRNLRRVA